MMQKNVFDPNKSSKAIVISNEGRTVQIDPEFKEDGFVKTVLGNCSMEKFVPTPSEEEMGIKKESKFMIMFSLDKVDSSCVCVGIQQVGADLEKDSFEFRYGFQLNCKNGDICRLSQRKEYVTTEVIESGCQIGVLLDMDNGELSFTLDGKNLGVASRDKRLKQGKYYAAVLLMSKKDVVTMVHPKKVLRSQVGFERLFGKLGVTPSENA